MRITKDITGQSFGRLTVTSRINYHGQVKWHCVCECGGTTSSYAYNLRNGNTKSCGCLRREKAPANSLLSMETNTTHGHTLTGNRSATYLSWSNMKKRCINPKATGYEYWGGRGIAVCERWHAFENFLEDMGERPPGTSLDRIDNDGNYEPSNCRWADRHTQNVNQRRRMVKRTPSLNNS